LAQAAGTGELRLTPWRAVLVPCAARDAEALRAMLMRVGLVTDPGDARLAVVACPGAPACARATTPAREDAEALAPLARALGEGVTLHVSGCAKGCARAAPARATLVGRDGRYDLVIDGTVGMAPAARALTRDGAAALLARLAASLAEAAS
jgi:precorrin-3B synthase